MEGSWVTEPRECKYLDWLISVLERQYDEELATAQGTQEGV